MNATTWKFPARFRPLLGITMRRAMAEFGELVARDEEPSFVLDPHASGEIYVTVSDTPPERPGANAPDRETVERMEAEFR